MEDGKEESFMFKRKCSIENVLKIIATKIRDKKDFVDNKTSKLFI